MIAGVRGREVLDSRGRPTVEAELELNDGTTVIASVPSGASRGRHEAVERRDGDPSRYGGRGVRGAVAAIEGEIAEFLTGREPDQRAIDGTLIELDGTRDKSRLGANAILAVSLAVARAAAARDGVPLWRSLAGGQPVTLPMPMVNIVSGGLHAGRQLDFQDFLAIPAGAGSYSQALEWVVRIHAAAGGLLAERGLTTLRADEGGYGPPLDGHRGALRLLDQAVVQADLRLGDDVVYGVDVAATHFFSQGRYALASEGRTLSPAEIADYVAELARDHPIASVEDPLAEDDWEAWAGFTARLGDRFQVVGDDLFTTNIERLERGIAERSANAVLVKMNQIGTISETLDVVARAKQAGFRTVISARSGETEDPALADLAVGCDGGQIKVGSVTQSERLAKYNQLLRIEQELGDDAVLAPWGRVG